MSEFQYQQQPQPTQTTAPADNVQDTDARQRMVRRANAGKRFCRNCGGEIQAGASVCVHCNAVLNPVAIKKAQELVMNRKAVVTNAQLRKSFFSYRKGMKLYRENIKERPQVAEPCKKAAFWGRITRIGIAAAIVLAIILL